ncbi:MAG: pilin [Thiobacillus sp.]|nr:pilin [Thiobacillus sp.]
MTQATSPYKLAVEACYQDTGVLGSCGTPGSNGIPSNATSNGKFVASVTTGNNGVVTATAASTNGLSGETIIFMPAPGSGSNLLDWTKSGTCVSAGIC